MNAVTLYPVYPHSFKKAVAGICNLNLQGLPYHPLPVILAEQKQLIMLLDIATWYFLS